MTRLAVVSLTVAVLLSSHLALPAADPAESPAAREFREVYDPWKSVLAEIAELQAKMTAGGGPDEATRKQYLALAAKANSLSPQLQAAAEKLYAVDDKNQQVADLLFTMAVNELRHDNYDEALRLARLLIEHKYSQQFVYRVAATAAFATMQLDEAKKLLAALDEPNDPDVIQMVKQLQQEIARYEPMWQREQKIRAAEAQADDLPRVKLHTNKGDIVLELFENEAPNTVANFISLVEKGFYDGTRFHRVLPGFMAQGGDPLSKNWEADPRAAGTGGPGYTIACECYELNHREHFRGSLSMAHAGRDTGGSQFFLTFAPTPHLDGKHTVFARVIEGLDVLSKLQRVNPEQPGEPPDMIVKAEVLRKRNHPYEPKTTPR